MCSSTYSWWFKKQIESKYKHLPGYGTHTSRIQVPFSSLHVWVLGCQPLIRPAKALSREHHSGIKAFKLLHYLVRPWQQDHIIAAKIHTELTNQSDRQSYTKWTAGIPVSEQDDLVCVIFVFKQFFLQKVYLVASTCMATHISPFPLLPKAQHLETTVLIYKSIRCQPSQSWTYWLVIKVSGLRLHTLPLPQVRNNGPQMRSQDNASLWGSSAGHHTTTWNSRISLLFRQEFQ